MKSFTDFIREINLTEFAIHYGYRMNVSKGRKWTVLVNKDIGDTVITRQSVHGLHLYYWNPLNDSDRGTIIQFVRNRLGILFDNSLLKKQAENINAVLYGYLKMPLPERKVFIPRQKTTPALFHPASLQPLADAGYLVNQRGIRRETLLDEVFAGTVEQMVVGGFVNIAFPYVDAGGMVVGAELCNRDFKAFAAGSNKAEAIWHSRILPETNNIVVCESGIDALSYHQLKGCRHNLYVSVGGYLSRGQIHAIGLLAAKTGVKQITGAFDNDLAGRKYSQACMEIFGNVFYSDIPEKKDFNEYFKRSV